MPSRDEAWRAWRPPFDCATSGQYATGICGACSLYQRWFKAGYIAALEQAKRVCEEFEAAHQAMPNWCIAAREIKRRIGGGKK